MHFYCRFHDSRYARPGFWKIAGFIKYAVSGNRKEALNYATEEMKSEVSGMDFMITPMAYGYMLLGEQDEAVNWLEKGLAFGNIHYKLYRKLFNNKLGENKRYKDFLAEIKTREDSFKI